MLGWFSRVPRLGWILVAALAMAACRAPAKPAIAVGEVAPPEDRIGIDDTFDVRVYGEGELSGTFRVATDGTIDYPLVGRLQVSGLRTGQIQQLLVAKLKGPILKEPQVIVTVRDRNSQKISVLGQVAKP